MNKTVINLLILFSLICEGWLQAQIYNPQKIKFTSGKEMYVVGHINAGTKLTLKKIINEEIIADKGYCGKSFDERSIKLIKMDKSLFNSIINSNTATEIMQGNSKFYIHCLSELKELKSGCKPEKQVKLKVKILQLFDEHNKECYNLILLN